MPDTPTFDDRMALCLSGGGFRAMLFHLGTVWRMREAGLLSRLSCISSVSGGSITAAVLGLAWPNLSDDAAGNVAFQTLFVDKIRAFARKTIDSGAVSTGALIPFVTIGGMVAKAYDKHLFQGRTLQDLPANGPEFIINATSLQTGARFTFERKRAGDYRIGYVENPSIPLSRAVGASSAFPPVLSPQVLKFKRGELTPPGHGRWDEVKDNPDYLERVVLVDGGVNDNMALNAVWGSETGKAKFGIQFVSDAGKKIRLDPEPGEDWARQSTRILSLIDDQVRNLHARWWFERKELKVVRGAFWNTRAAFGQPPDIYSPSASLRCDPSRTSELASVPTRLSALKDNLQERLINWGYASCDAALRRQYNTALPEPSGFPYSGTKV